MKNIFFLFLVVSANLLKSQGNFTLCDKQLNGVQTSSDNIATKYIDLKADSIVYYRVCKGFYYREVLPIKDIKEVVLFKSKKGSMAEVRVYDNPEGSGFGNKVGKSVEYVCEKGPERTTDFSALLITFSSEDLAKEYYKKIKKMAGL
jgi:hypothetical protein